MANRLLNAVVRNSHWTSVYCIPTLLNTWKVLAKSIKEHHWSLLEQNQRIEFQEKIESKPKLKLALEQSITMKEDK